MESKNYKIPTDKKKKVELLKALNNGKMTMQEFITGLLPERFLKIEVNSVGLKYKGNPITKAELEQIIIKEKEGFNLTIIWTNRYTTGQAPNPIPDIKHLFKSTSIGILSTGVPLINRESDVQL